jgi:hypothetical protein
MKITFKNNNIYYYHYKIFRGELSWVLLPSVLVLIYYYNSYIKYVSLILLLIGIVGTIGAYNRSKKYKLLGLLIVGLITHIPGFYPLLNITKYFEYNNIIYYFGLLALAITYFLPYWPYNVSRKLVGSLIILLYSSYTLYHIYNNYLNK